MSAADRILERVTGVRSIGPGRWLAKCPAHEDRRPSLSIRETDDGRVLLNDFGGCSTSDVLGAIGMTLAQLFPERLQTDGKPLPAHERPQLPARAAQQRLAEAAHEATVLAIILSDLDGGAELTQALATRFATGAGRILALAQETRLQA